MADGGEPVDMAQMLKALLEDRKRREEEWAEERRRWEEENRAREAEIREERRRRDEALAKREETRTQMSLLQSLIEGVKRQSEAAVRKAGILPLPSNTLVYCCSSLLQLRVWSDLVQSERLS